MSGLLIRGTTITANINRYDWDAAGTYVSAGVRPTVAAGLAFLTPRTVAEWTGDTNFTHAGCEPSGNADLMFNLQVGSAGATNLRAALRIAAGNTYNSLGVPIALDTPVWIAMRVDYAATTEGVSTPTVTFFAAGGQLGSPVALPAGSTYRGSQFKPFVRGRQADSKDIEWHGVYYWHNANDLVYANADSYVPTAAQLAAYTAGASIASWPTPKSAMVASGTNGAYAASFADTAVPARTFSHTNGATSGAFAPTFVGSAEITAGSFVASSQYADFTFTHAATGTAHTIVGLASANAGTPTGGQIKLQKNQDGTDAVSYGSLDAGEAGTKTQRVTGLAAGFAMKAFTTIETAPDVFTPVISWTFTTPRIGIRTIPLYTPGSTPALWASQTAIDFSVAAADQPSVLGSAETNSSGQLEADLSAATSFYLPVGAAAKIGWEKGSNSGYRSETLVNLDA